MDIVPTSLLLPGSFLLTALLTLTPADPAPLEVRVLPEPATARIAAPSFLITPCTGCAALTPVEEFDASKAVPVSTPGSFSNGDCEGTIPECTAIACKLSGQLKIKNVSGGSLFAHWIFGDPLDPSTEEITQEFLDQEHFVRTFDNENIHCGELYQVSARNAAGQQVGRYVASCTQCPL